jgi:RluA family pseudouridine synthase
MKALPPLDIVYEDEVLLALNKPSGLLIAPDRWDKGLDNLMTRLHTQKNPNAFNVHRIDKDTSGLVLCAKDNATWKRLFGWFASHKINKRYLCLTRGAPVEKEFEVALALAPNPQRRGRMMVSKHGKKARTLFQTLEFFRRYALVEARPVTGRQHQIRVHLAAAGIPLLADPFYGDGKPLLLSTLKRGFKEPREGERPLIARTALHALSLEFTHPATGATIKLEAPPPKDFELALKYLRKFAGT